MFGPNAPGRHEADVAFHHRGEAFHRLMRRLDAAFHGRLNVPEDQQVLFMPCGGTLAVESAVASLAATARPPEVRGRFTERLGQAMRHYGVSDHQATRRFDVHLETSASSLAPGPAWFLDAVSSFPYYPVPASTSLAVTVSGKQLGASPGLAVALVREDAWEGLRPENAATALNLANYRAAARRDETPTTPPLALMVDLAQRLEAFDLEGHRRSIDIHSDLLTAVLGMAVRGERRSPVITVRSDVIPHDVAQRYGLYRSSASSPHYHIFTYSATTRDYEELAEALRRR